MHNLQTALLFMTLTTTVITGLETIAHTSSQDIYLREDILAQTQWEFVSIDTRVENIFKKDKTGGSSRSEGFCFISPNPDSDFFKQTWSLQPTFAWKEADVAQLVVEHSDQEEPLWTYNVEDTQKKYVTYDGAPLQPGENYTLVVKSHSSISRSGNAAEQGIPLIFNTLDTSKNTDISNTIQSQLNNIEAQLGNTSNTLLIQERMLQRADVFASIEDHDLWMDVVRELLAVSENGNTEEVQSAVQKQFDAICRRD